MTLVDCLSAAFVPFDTDDLRAQLICQAELVKTRNDCLQSSSSCADADMNCSSQATCPMFDPQVLTKVLLACPGAPVLGR